MEKFSDVRVFAGYRMNLDGADETLEPNEGRETYNLYEPHGSGKLTNMKGFENVMDLAVNSAFALPVGGVFKCIGTTKDVEESAIMYCLCDTAGTQHSIMRMTTDDKRLEWVLKNESLLNFQEEYRIEMNILDGLMYFTDGFEGEAFVDYNPPRKINLLRSLGLTNPFDTTKLYKPGEHAGYLTRCYEYIYATTSTVNILPTNTTYWEEVSTNIYTAFTAQVLDRIKYPPTAPPTVSYGDDLTITTNLLRNKLFRFSYRYVYDDGEKSTWSSISNVPMPTVVEGFDGSYVDDESKGNVINVYVGTSIPQVIRIEIAVQEGDVGAWRLCHRKHKYDQDGAELIPSNTSVLYKFYDTDLCEAISQEDFFRPYDAVPQISTHEKLIEKNRILDADYVESFDNIDIDVELTTEQEDAGLGITFMPGIDFSLETYPPLTPLDGYYKYAMGIKWNDGSVHLGYPQSPQQYSCVVMDWRNVPIVYGQKYRFFFSAPFYVYNSLEFASTVMKYPTDNEGDQVSVEVEVTLQQGEKLKDLLNYICLSARGGTSGNSAIAFVDSSHIGTVNGTHYNNHIWGYYTQPWTVQGGIPPDPFDHLIYDSQLGVVLQFGGEGGVDFSKVTIGLTIESTNIKTETWKSGEDEILGLVYYDRAGRSGFVHTDDDCRVTIPTQASTSTGIGHYLQRNYIKWQIDHIPPIWATRYRWARASDVTSSYYIQVPIANMGLSQRIQSFTGNFISLSVQSNFSETRASYSKFNIAAYTYEAGDRLRFVLIGSRLSDNREVWETFWDELDFEIVSVEVPIDSGSGETYLHNDLAAPEYIKDADGNNIKDDGQTKIIIPHFNYPAYGIDPDSLEDNKVIIEIYRPAKNLETQLFREMSESFPVLNPHTATRAHEGGSEVVLSGWNRNQESGISARGVLTRGDAYIYSRFLYNENFGALFPCESQFYSDWYDSQITDIGKENAENKDAKRTRYKTGLLFSGKYIQNTRVNGLSNVDSSDSIELQEKFGAINSIEEVGDTLKILQKSKPSSIRIGRAGVTQPTEAGTEIISSTKDVLGTLYVHSSDYGTVHSGSYLKFEKKAYFFDFDSFAICRDAGNGIQDVSEEYKIKTFLKARCELFGTAENVDVISAYDQENDLAIFTFIDKTTTANSFTIMFKENNGKTRDGFVSFAEFLPDMYGTAKQTLTMFKGNGLWLANSETALRGNFFGTQYKYWVTIMSNKMALTIKRWLSIFVSSSKKLSAPDAGDISIAETGNTPGGMVSLLRSGSFDSIQGKYVAEFGKNMTTNQATASITDLVEGDDLEGQALSVRLEGEETEEHGVLAIELQGVTSKI